MSGADSSSRLPISTCRRDMILLLIKPKLCVPNSCLTFHLHFPSECTRSAVHLITDGDTTAPIHTRKYTHTNPQKHLFAAAVHRDETGDKRSCCCCCGWICRTPSQNTNHATGSSVDICLFSAYDFTS